MAGSGVVPISVNDVGALGHARGEGRYLVQFSDGGTTMREHAAGLAADGFDVHRTLRAAVKVAVVTASPEEVAALTGSPEVVAIAPDAPVNISTEWGLDRIDQRDLPLSESFTPPGTGAGVNAYIVDTGVRADHVDFGGRVAAGWTAIADGNGTTNCHGHGTHVAGTVAGAEYGVARQATVVPVRVLGCTGSGLTSNVVAGLNWVADHHTGGSPAVVNLSFGSATNSVVDAALQALIDDGVLAAVAAGNTGTDACGVSPARVPAALTVGASDMSDSQAGFSNHGSCLDMYAPGTNIGSSWYTSPTSSATRSGTSMASPHVAGAAAVLLGINPSLTPAQVADLLISQATHRVPRSSSRQWSSTGSATGSTRSTSGAMQAAPVSGASRPAVATGSASPGGAVSDRVRSRRPPTACAFSAERSGDRRPGTWNCRGRRHLGRPAAHGRAHGRTPSCGCRSILGCARHPGL